MIVSRGPELGCPVGLEADDTFLSSCKGRPLSSGCTRPKSKRYVSIRGLGSAYIAIRAVLETEFPLCVA